MTTAFTQLTAIAAALPKANIDTDMIIPAAFLKTVSRKGLRDGLFHAARFDREGQERPDFILNRAPWRQAGILITLGNFGCGSSREHAPWALIDYGIKCLIAPGFADIFFNNCFKNGILPIILPEPQIDRLMQIASAAETAMITVDLKRQIITNSASVMEFSIESQRRERLLLGIDEIARSLREEPAIGRYEAMLNRQPWRAPKIHFEG